MEKNKVALRSLILAQIKEINKRNDNLRTYLGAAMKNRCKRQKETDSLY